MQSDHVAVVTFAERVEFARGTDDRDVSDLFHTCVEVSVIGGQDAVFRPRDRDIVEARPVPDCLHWTAHTCKHR